MSKQEIDDAIKLARLVHPHAEKIMYGCHLTTILADEIENLRAALEVAEKYMNDRNVGQHCPELGVVREALR